MASLHCPPPLHQARNKTLSCLSLSLAVLGEPLPHHAIGEGDPQILPVADGHVVVLPWRASRLLGLTTPLGGVAIYSFGAMPVLPFWSIPSDPASTFAIQCTPTQGSTWYPFTLAWHVSI